MLGGTIDRALSEHIVAAGLSAERRLGIYRANVVLSLRRLLESTFPACRRLLGVGRFADLADAFVRESPPARPQLIAYGAAFPTFLAPVDRLMADVARLEWAREEAYHAADAPSLNVSMLAAIPVDLYANLRFEPHPSLRLVRSAGPVHALWSGGPVNAGAEQVLVLRSGMNVTTRPIAAADLALLDALIAGLPLKAAATAALAVQPDFDLQSALADHLTGGSFAACH